MQRWACLCLIGLSVSLSACALMGQRQQYLHGPETSLPDYKDKALGDADAETTVLQAYRQRAGLLAGENFPPEKDPAWQLIMRAGLNAIDEQCEKYIDAIFWANRDLRTAGSEINLLARRQPRC